MKYIQLLLIGFLVIHCTGKKSITSAPESKKNEKEIVEEKEKDREKEKIKDSEVSLDVKIGQMIMIGLNERTSLSPKDSFITELNNKKIGGIIIFEKNIAKTNSEKTLKKLIDDLQNSSPIPLFISIDEEGGKVHRLKEKYGFVKMPSAAYLGALNNLDSTYYYSNRLARELSDLGININFAPVVDLALNPANPIIAKVERSYSNKPDAVVAQAGTFIKAHQNQKVITVLKHFPGHGSSAGDTHKGIVDVTKQWQFKELIPYKELIEENKCDAIISCHVINCHLDTTCVPSTLSRIITTDILRGVLGFKGVVFSDDMQMHAISKSYGLEQAIVMAINAGVDVLVFGNNVNLSDKMTSSQIHSIIKRLVQSGEISEARINEAYERIINLKRKI